MCIQLNEVWSCGHTRPSGFQKCNKPVGVEGGCFGPSGTKPDPDIPKHKSICSDCVNRLKDPNPAGREEERKRREEEQRKRQGQ